MRTTMFLLLSIVAIAGVRPLAAQPYQFYPLTPCRVVDTRNATATNGGPWLGTTARDFQIRGNCGVPLQARAAVLNITVTAATANSWLIIWPSGQAKPWVSAINFDTATWATANGAIAALSSNTNDLSVANATGNVHCIIDVTGYFQ